MNIRHFSVMLACISALFLILPSFANADSNDGSTFVVTAITDVTDATPGDGVCETAPGNGMCTLRAAIMEANALIGEDTIVLPAESYYLTIAGAGEDGSATGDLDITDDLIIQGPADSYALIDAFTSDDRLLDVHFSADLSISKLHIDNGIAPLGGGIRNAGNTELNDVVLWQNEADMGGGIYNTGGLTLVDVVFQANSANDSGGGLYSSGQTSVVNCRFSNNEAVVKGGGADYSGNNQSSFMDTSFLNNDAQSGGGFYNEADITMIDVQFYNNTSSTGAGIYNAGTLVIHGAWILENSANLVGGGIFNRGAIQLDNARVNKSSAKYGAAIYNDATGNLTLENVSFTENTAESSSGGIYNDAGTLHAHAVSFDQNVVTMAGAAAIQNVFNGQVEISQAIFSNNQAEGSAGAIANISGKFTLTDATITRNVSTYYGGGIYNDGQLALVRVTITDNEAEDGGGITNDMGGTIRMENSTVSGNSAVLNGGGIYNFGTIYSYHNTITANVASSNPISPSGSGGGVYDEDGAGFMFEDTILYGNFRQTIGLFDNDCVGTLETLTYNLVGTLDDCALTGDASFDLIGIDPLLGPLADNGGLTMTHALPLGSPAIDAANPAGCYDMTGHIFPSDQRGHQLPWDGDGDGTARCDIGSYEAPQSIVFLPLTLK